ncbi:predicted protein [Arabidopsis lyrata subsp. lyrata]|uniref:Predicted protein n=1 Tax=Arabidopsis lyrata subsp. lyrata TaxID=81972 RepID=D7MIQ8_ARALL|nr:predicted protein [Arabidopsis lyrata subsp. lyrata]
MGSKKKDFGGCRDIISDLPDAVICHILSFLPTKEAASTTVLAKRWKPLLRCVPSLEFDDSLCFHPPMTYEERSTNARSFMRFVDGVALQGNAKINRFHFKGEDIIDQMWVLEMIPNVLKRGVSDLDLDISSIWDSFDSMFYHLPPKIFVSETLVRLKLKFVQGVNISVEDSNGLTGTFNKLLSGCHALEELLLYNLMWDKSLEPGPFFVNVSIPTLKRLTFRRFEEFDEAEDFNKSVSLSIFENPNLVYIEYIDSIADRYQQGMHHIYSDRCEDEDGCLCRHPTGFGGEVVARTCLSSSPVKVLKILNFGEICDDHEDVEVDDEDEEFVYCLREQIEHVEHFIEKMPNLEQVILHYYTSNDEDVMMKVFKKLEKLPRVASANCKIQLISDNLSSNASD